MGLCPFHSERSPSFTVSAEKKLFHCFGCQESGDHITFIMKIENLSFTDAIRQIATKAGIPIEEDEKTTFESQDDKDRGAIQDLLVVCREWFKQHFPGSLAEDYAKKRGLTELSLAEFHIGYCPPNLDLNQILLGKGYAQELLAKSGLFFKTERGDWVCRFRGRLMFPVHDERSRLVGFGGRLVQPSESAAKYINSEETLLFNKRRVLYGLDLAKQAIKAQDKAIVVEGYMDVMVSHQFGFKNTVATLGTALTNEHAIRLKRFTQTVVLGFDSDEAGQRAVERSFEVLRQQELKVFVLALPEKDPADVLTEQGEAAYRALVESPKSIIEVMFERLLQKYPGKRIEYAADILRLMAPLLKAETDDVVQKYYIRHMAKTLNVEPEWILDRLRMTTPVSGAPTPNRVQPQKNKFDKAEETVLAGLVGDLNLRTHFFTQWRSEAFTVPDHRELAEQLAKSDLVDQAFLGSLTDPQLKQKMGRVMMAAHDGFQIEACLKLFEETRAQRRIETLKSRVAELEKLPGQEPEINALLTELQSLLRKESHGGAQ